MDKTRTKSVKSQAQIVGVVAWKESLEVSKVSLFFFSMFVS